MTQSPPPAGDALFTFDRVTVERGGGRLLADVTVAVPDGGITAVLGPSGAGKSTLLRLCNRLDVPSAGTVRFRGRDVAAVDPLWLRRQVGMVFQRPALFGGSVRDNLAVARPGAGDDRYAAALRAAALDPDLLDRPAATLSGGEAQRACLARTLVTDPAVLLLDEPTSALDSAPKLAFERTATALARQGMPMLWVTHEPAQVRRLAGHVLALVEGRLVYAGEPGRVEEVPALRALFTTGGA